MEHNLTGNQSDALQEVGRTHSSNESQTNDKTEPVPQGAGVDGSRRKFDSAKGFWSGKSRE